MKPSKDLADRAVRYFDRPGFRRALQAVWRKYASLGRIGGRAVIERASEAECEALGAFFGWDCKPGETIAIPLELFDRELRNSAFEIDLPGLHVLLEGKPLQTKRERQESREMGWRRLFADVRAAEGGKLAPAVEEWLAYTEQGAGAGSRTLQELYKTSPEAAQTELSIAVRALSCLLRNDRAQTPIRLPVLAARVSGDAHALDLNRPAGRMLFAALRREREGGTPDQEPATVDAADGEDGSETLKIRELYRSFGVWDDDLSSIVHGCVPIPGQPVRPAVWTLRQVDAETPFPRCSSIYIVENPAVFSTILDLFPPAAAKRRKPAALLCTSGPASAAAIRWIQRCLESSGDDCRLYYSGDFDIKGLAMGQTLQRLFPDRFTPWRFDADTYLDVSGRGYPGPSFDETELAKLEKMKLPWDGQLCDAMRRIGRKAFQELLVERLTEDFVRESEG
jgi:uncharacterized protein (TIGR02679 family)